ncbi:lipid-transfer protein [Hydrogenophaga sp. T4]|nr:lipid-transfer protein [Hydrogenophaga sp. T4]
MRTHQRRGCSGRRVFRSNTGASGQPRARHQGAGIGHCHGQQPPPEDLAQHITVKAAKQAYELAGVGPQDISLAEVHDATAIGEIVQSENLGFCAFGEGGPLAESGGTTIGGRIPINTSGGLESKGHPIGATGLGQLHELVVQLRGEAGARQVQGARLAIAENGGGLFGIEEAVAAITILGR